METKRTLAVRCLVIFVLSLGLDLLASVHIRKVVSGEILAAVGTIILMQYLPLIGQAWFVDAKSKWPRFWFATATAAGAGLGTFLVLI